MKIVPITVTANGVEKTHSIRRLKYRERMRIVGLLRKGLPAPDIELDENGHELRDEAGDPVFVKQVIPIENIAEFQVALIAASICNEAGKPFFTVDEVDEWDVAELTATANAIDVANKAGDGALEVERGNSSATGNEGTSSS